MGNPTPLVNTPIIYGQLTTDSIIPSSRARGFERKRTLNSAGVGVSRRGGWTYHTLLQEGATRAVEVKPFLTGWSERKDVCNIQQYSAYHHRTKIRLLRQYSPARP